MKALQHWSQLDPPLRESLEPLLAEYENAAKQGKTIDRQPLLDKCPNDATREFLKNEMKYFDEYYSNKNSKEELLSTPTNEDNFEGRVLCQRYEVKKHIETGGFGDVYAAVDRKHDQNVALKIPHGNFSKITANEVSQRESDALSRLSHERIVQRLNTVVEDNRIIVVTQWVDGISLDRVLREGPIAVDEATLLGIEICQGLEHAHQNGVIHRDIKPHNIMIDRQGHAKILDFGLSRLLNIHDHSPGKNSSVNGQLKGSLSYMSPEQARGQIDQIDHRSDIFSLGVVLYQMLTGINPFSVDGESSTDLVLNHNPVVPSQLNSQVSSSLDSIVIKALRKDKNKRFSSAKSLQTALDSTIRDSHKLSTVAVPEKDRRWSTSNLVAVASLAALLCFLVFSVINTFNNGAGNQLVSPAGIVEHESGQNKTNAPLPDAQLPFASAGKEVVRISTNPPGGKITAYPIGDNGEPDYDNGVAGNNENFEAELSQGLYLFSAVNEASLYHEVIRTVPGENDVLPIGPYSYQFSLRDEKTGFILLNEIRLFETDSTGMILDGDYFFDQTEIQYDQELLIRRGRLPPKEKNGAVVFVEFGYAMEYLERQGKRLPFFGELKRFHQRNTKLRNDISVDEWTATSANVTSRTFEKRESKNYHFYEFRIWHDLVEQHPINLAPYTRDENTGFRGVRKSLPRYDTR